jgi:hypothetical protein
VKEGRVFSIPQSVQKSCWSQPSLLHSVYRGVGGRDRLGLKADLSPASTVEIGIDGAVPTLPNGFIFWRVVNPWITEQKKKNFLLLRNWVHFVPIFFNYFSNFFRGSINKLNCGQNGKFIQIFTFSFNHIDKMFDEKK